VKAFSARTPKPNTHAVRRLHAFRRSRAFAKVAAAALGVVVFVLVLVEAASAHSFLVSTTPGQGERLGASPEVVLLEFSESIDLDTVALSLATGAGVPVEELSAELAAGGLAVRAQLPDVSDGIYVVSWQALSAIDGHGSSGEFAYAVGEISGSIPAATTRSPRDVSALGSSWLFISGLSAAVGALVMAMTTPLHRGATTLVARIGFCVAGVGVVVGLVGGSTNTTALLFALQALLAGIGLTAARRPAWPLAAAVVATGFWSTQGHGADDGVIGWSLDVLHLAAAAGWVGSLGVAIGLAAAAHRRGEPWTPTIATYAKSALGFVVVLGLAGVIAAVRLVSAWDDLWSTTYGQIVVAKAALLALAMGTAGIGRWRGLHRQRRRVLGVAVGIELPVIVVAAALAALLTAGAPPAPVAASELLGPPPLAATVTRDAGLAGNLNVEVAADGDRLDVKVFGPSGPLPGTEVSVSVLDEAGTATDLVPRPCGSGCVTQALALSPGVSQIRVSATAPEWTGGTFGAELVWPPGDRVPQRVIDMIETMRAVPELSMTETVDSGPGSTVTPGTFTLSGDQLMDAEPYAGGNVEEVVQLPGEQNRLRLYLPGSQIFAEMELDERGRLLSARLITPGHLITRTFTYPDGG